MFENSNDKMTLEEYRKLEAEREELEREQAARIAEENKKLIEYRQEQALDYQRKREEKRARIMGKHQKMMILALNHHLIISVLAAVEAERAQKNDNED